MSRLTRAIAPALLLATGLGLAIPAQAADHSRYGTRHDVRHDVREYQRDARAFDKRADIAQLRRDIDRAAERRTISQREASGLRRDARDLERQYMAFSRGGLTRPEQRMIEQRIERIRVALRAERRDFDRRRG